MSKINTLRIINLNYNNNSIKISDEAFHMNGESTLLSLRNGGGKTVLVQMMTAPFVHKRYRDTKDRPFESYFTTNKPTFILVEWVLDGGVGYVLTGMMVRKNQEIAEGEVQEELEIYNFISEYQERCDRDIFNLPVVEKTDSGMKLKSWGNCKKLFEEIKKENGTKFQFFAMNQPAQSRMYFERLKEYQINHKEWESIIKKVNLKESGLSELFADCRDEKGLVEKWFLDAVESKLNKETNRVKEFQNIVMKYVKQYRENQTKITRLATIREFQEQAGQLKQHGEGYLDITSQRLSYESQIAAFRNELQKMCEEAGETTQEIRRQIEELEQELKRIEYEKISYDIYVREDRKKHCAKDRELYVLEKEEIEKEVQGFQKERNLQECARSLEEKRESLAECKALESRLKVSRQDEREKEPQRRQLGSQLFMCYGRKVVEGEENLAQIQKQLQELTQEEESWKQRQEKYQQNLTDKSAGIGALQEKILSYDGAEDSFKEKYEVILERNILGEYEADVLEMEQQRENTLLREVEDAISRCLNGKEQCSEAIRKAERDGECAREDQRELQMQIRELENLLSQYEEQLEQRRVVLKYVSMGEAEIFQKEKIQKEISKKLEEIDHARTLLELEYQQMKQVSGKLQQGRIMEIPVKLQEYLIQQEITAIYGMDWLGKNGRSVKENQEIVKKQPFLPYSIILTEKDMQKLQQAEPEIYTTSPIPMLVREELEEYGKSQDSSVFALENVRFYMHFQEDILDEKGRERLVQLQQQEMEKKLHAIGIKKEEYTSYFSKLELLKAQTVTKENYQNTKSELEKSENKQRNAQKQIEEADSRKRQLQKQLQNLEVELLENSQKKQLLAIQIGDLDALVKRYRSYLQDKKNLEQWQEDVENLKNQLQQAKEKLEQLQTTFIQVERKLMEGKSELKDRKEKQAVFQQFSDVKIEGDDARTDISAEQLLEIEAQYDALTQGFSQEIQLLEEHLIKEQRRYQRQSSDLESLLKRYGFQETEIEGVSYSRDRLFELEEQLQKRERKLSVKIQKIHELDTKIQIEESKIQDNKSKMLQECGKREPVSRETISNLEFSKRKGMVLSQKDQLEKEEVRLRHRIQNFETNLTSTSEFDQLTMEEGIGFTTSLTQLSEEELDQFKGTLLRDYRESQRQEMEARESIVNKLNEMARTESFQEEFFAKPLEIMLGLVANAKDLMKQLEIISESYGSMIEKLEVDISMIEKEKIRILDLLTDYVHEIHENLGKIDRNSTIQVRGRAIKMLKIRMPEWEDNQETYALRVQDLLEDVTRRGLEFLEQNANLEEMTGVYINTSNLYDTVVGNGNIAIQLYKIEEQKEYPISWSDVAKNSGGEGFLSAFIVLSSLLYYMRKDDADIFADRNEGKVLVMDNPFAQTNAAHLLKPLMDMAKKTNTQLICLSGLGGDSIYNRFDNIYVLSLVAASLRAGTQYLQGEHLRGEEQESMVAARFHVEQQTLLF